MDKTYKLLGQMAGAAAQLRGSIDEVFFNLSDAQAEYSRLSSEGDFLTGSDDDAEYLAEDMDDVVESSADYLQNAVDNLADFDKALMKLILIRGKLAEEIGIPLGGKQWVRYETYDM